MFSDQLETVKFRYTGYDIDAILDRLPTAKIVKEEEQGWIIQAEVFGKGMEIWLRGQGENVSIIAK